MGLFEIILESIMGSIVTLMGLYVVIMKKYKWIASFSSRILEKDHNAYAICMGILTMLIGIGIILMPIFNSIFKENMGYIIGVPFTIGAVLLMVLADFIFKRRWFKYR